MCMPPVSIPLPLKIQGSVGAVEDGGGIDGEDKDVREGHECGGASEGETEGVTHHAKTLTDDIHSQRSAQNGGAAGNGIGEHFQCPLHLPYSSLQ